MLQLAALRGRALQVQVPLEQVMLSIRAAMNRSWLQIPLGQILLFIMLSPVETTIIQSLCTQPPPLE